MGAIHALSAAIVFIMSRSQVTGHFQIYPLIRNLDCANSDWSQCTVHLHGTRGVDCSWSWSLSFEGDSDSGPYLFHLDFCV